MPQLPRLARQLPRLVYLSSLAILVAAGMVLTSRGALAPDPARVPSGCASLPRSAVEAVVDAAPAAEEERTGDDGQRFGRWLDGAGEVLVELQCDRATLLAIQAQRDLVERAREGTADVVVLETEPAATLDVTPMGTVIVQVDDDTRLVRTWFVAAPLGPDEAEQLVRETLAAQAAAV